MKVIQTFAAVLISMSAVVATEAAEEGLSQEDRVLQSLSWIKGPANVQVGENAKFAVPNDYVFLNTEDTKRLMELMQNPTSGKEYYFGPADNSWFAVFEYDDTGHVRDDEKIDAAAVLESIRAGNEQGNKERVERGWPTMRVVGWKYEPFYDPSTRRLNWAIEGESSGHSIINYNTRILGRTGVTSALLVADPAILDTAVPQFNAAVAGYEFNPGQRYAEFQEGDHVAEFGLAALVAGGAAAVATKKGFWAAIAGFFAAGWKLIVAGVVGIGAWFRSAFKKKS